MSNKARTKISLVVGAKSGYAQGVTRAKPGQIIEKKNTTK